MNKQGGSVLSLRAIIPGFIILTIAQLSIQGIQQEPPDKKALLDRLLADYKKYELPLPPNAAPLVRYEVGARTDHKSKPVPLIALGFVTQEDRAGEPAQILIGTMRMVVWGKARPTPVKPEPGVEKGIEVSGYGQFATNACLATAIQCHARGWSDLAVTLFDLSMKKPFDHRIEREGYDRETTPATELAFLAWAHRANELFLPDTDRSVILRRLKALIATEPRLNVDYNRDLIASLEATLLPSKAKPGSIESMIDDLVELCPGDLSHDPPVRALALIERGLDAVSGFIANLDDKRLTRFYFTGFGSHAPTYPWSVGGVCWMLLRDLIGYETIKTWESGESNDAEWKKRAQAWFEAAREKGEEPYLVANALPPGDWPNMYVLRVLSKKHPEHLDRLYRDLLEKRRGMQSWPLAEQIARSGLPRERKLDILKIGARDKSLDHRYAALWSLQEVDPEACVTLLAETLDSLPPTCQGKYSDSREASFGLLVRRTADPRAWTALAGAARRADAGLRLELLRQVAWEGTEGGIRTQQVGFLTGFLTDETLRIAADNPTKFDGLFVAHRFPRIEVRNVAAMMLASIVGLEADPEPDWTAEQWAALRERVKLTLPK